MHGWPTVAICLVACTLAACGPPPVPPGEVCSVDLFDVDDDFPGARRGDCKSRGDSKVRLDIRPEDENVTNRSPWFSFRITPRRPGTATIVLDYGDFEHRYIPKLSSDRASWQALDPADVFEKRKGRIATFDVDLGDEPVFVSAQELITSDIYDIWFARLTFGMGADRSTLAHSIEGRPIDSVSFDGDSREVVLLTARQHPPEVSGAFAFFVFVETLAADTDLARAFRERYDIIAVPLINPDGVEHGHWRHNLGGLDLNRDWGDFSQPETQFVPQLLERLKREEHRVRYFLDFHSTDRNLFYTFPDEMLETPDFFRAWFARVRERIPEYEFTNENARPETEGVGKNYINERFGIVAATYEVGDETDRDLAQKAAHVFAEEFMKLLLEE